MKIFNFLTLRSVGNLLGGLLLLSKVMAATQDRTNPSDSSKLSSDNPIYANGYATGLTAGMNQCRKFPASCGIGAETQFTSTIEIAPTGYIINIINGADQCTKDPASCGIVVNQNTDGSTQAGIAQCQTDPDSCGLKVKGTKEAGIAQCRDNPQSCGIEVDKEALLQQGIEMCKANPAFYGIAVNNTLPIHAIFSISEGWLYLPAVDVSNLLDKSVTTYEVSLKLITGLEPLSFSLVEAIPK